MSGGKGIDTRVAGSLGSLKAANDAISKENAALRAENERLRAKAKAFYQLSEAAAEMANAMFVPDEETRPHEYNHYERMVKKYDAKLIELGELAALIEEGEKT